eukprot:COSAG05_NODE_9621_length_611_cov_1.039062_1_plen_160_part_00
MPIYRTDRILQLSSGSLVGSYMCRADFSNQLKIHIHFSRAHACFVKYFLMIQTLQQIIKLALSTLPGARGQEVSLSPHAPSRTMRPSQQHQSISRPRMPDNLRESRRHNKRLQKLLPPSSFATPPMAALKRINKVRHSRVAYPGHVRALDVGSNRCCVP